MTYMCLGSLPARHELMGHVLRSKAKSKASNVYTYDVHAVQSLPLRDDRPITQEASLADNTYASLRVAQETSVQAVRMLRSCKHPHQRFEFVCAQSKGCSPRPASHLLPRKALSASPSPSA